MGQLSPLEHALAGALGGVFSNAVVYPLDTVKTRIQVTEDERQITDCSSSSTSVAGHEGKKKVLANGKKATSITQGFLKILRSQEGFMGLYRGFGASMVNTFSTQFAYFYWYTVVRELWIRRLSPVARRGGAAASKRTLDTATELLLGAMAGALAQVFTIPVSVIATRQQVGGAREDEEKAMGTKDEKKRKQDDGFWQVAKDIMAEDGPTGFWRGLKPSLVLTANPAITYGVFERIKGIVLGATGGSMGPYKSFLVGATSKTLATVITFPLILAKIRTQARSSKSDRPALEAADGRDKSRAQSKSFIDILVQIHKEKGFKGWYQGMNAQIYKAVLAQALLFMMKDFFERWALVLLALIRRYQAKGRVAAV